MKVELEEGCLRTGSILQKTYELKEILSKGEVSIVYIALHVKDGQKYIVKEYFPARLAVRDMDNKTVVCKKPSLREKFHDLRDIFLNEAWILKKFNHQNIGKYIDHFIENDTGYIVTEYYEGKTLDKYMKENEGMMTSDFLKKIYIPLVDAMVCVHKRGILHRDLKPSNIIVNQEGVPVIIDFGSAIKYRKCEKKKIFVTAGFSPLEFYSENSKQDKYSDIYSLTAILYYCLCGRAPEEAPKRVIEDNIENIKALNEEISLLFSSIIMKNLSVKYKNRISSLKLFKMFIYWEYFILRIKERTRQNRESYE